MKINYRDAYESSRIFIELLKNENEHLNLQLDQALKDYEELQEENEILKRENNLLKADIEASQEIISDYKKEQYLVDKLTRQLTDEYKNTEYQCKEKERLNNIINELEIFLNKVASTSTGETITCNNILKYLQELKENKQ